MLLTGASHTVSTSCFATVLHRCVLEADTHCRPQLGTLSDLFRMLSPSSVKQIPVRYSLQLQLLSRISQIWLPADSKSTDRNPQNYRPCVTERATTDNLKVPKCGPNFSVQFWER